MEDKEIKEEKKSGGNKVLIIIIVILLLIIAGGFGYFLGSGSGKSEDKKDDKEANETIKEQEDKDEEETKEEEKPEEEKIEQLTKDSPVVKKLFETYKEVSSEGGYDIHRNYDLTKRDVKMSMAFSALEKEGKTIKRTCGSLSKPYVATMYFCDSYNLTYDKNGNIDYAKYGNAVNKSETITLKTNDLKNKYLELFGKNAQYTDGDFELTHYPGGYAYFDKSNDLYAKFSTGGGSEVVDATHDLDSIEQNGSSLVLYTTLNSSGVGVKKITYTFEYEKETGNYIFVSRVEK